MADSIAEHTLAFHYDLYSSKALGETCVVFDDYTDIERSERAPYFLVKLSSKGDGDFSEIVRSFSNYVLGLTIEERRSGS